MRDEKQTRSTHPARARVCVCVCVRERERERERERYCSKKLCVLRVLT